MERRFANLTSQLTCFHCADAASGMSHEELEEGSVMKSASFLLQLLAAHHLHGSGDMGDMSS